MLTLLILAIAFLLIFAIVAIVIGAGGVALFIVFGDLIVAIAIIWLIIKFIRRKK